MKRKRDTSSKSSTSGSSTHKLPKPKLQKSRKESVSRSRHLSSVPSLRREVGVSDPEYLSEHSGGDSLSDEMSMDDQKKRAKNVKKKSAGRLSMHKLRQKVSVSGPGHSDLYSGDLSSADISSDEKKRKVKGVRVKSAAVSSKSSDDEQHRAKYRPRKKSAGLSNKSGMRVTRKLVGAVLPSDDGGATSRRSVSKKGAGVGSSSDDGQEQSRRRASRRSTDSTLKQPKKDAEVKECTVSDLKDAWRREFRIKGQIGKVGDKEN